jgi:CHAD domain-containing protein
MGALYRTLEVSLSDLTLRTAGRRYARRRTRVACLSSENFTRFSDWFEEFLAEQWDRKIEQEVLDGRSDSSATRANDHFDAGRRIPI